ncbi:hypothetical protein [Chitinophaga sp. sic0106]|uniref:head-tail joining protein n=1 Tax=Chitinophaga sp. sic0106 TaxID=2854785 RepID=UPI001C449AFC|nr:hypothetical protein [Chitinophaga sp. sic0106]MBV7529031.1 hypothetical protein [Chitinophaga sp. sic0106]
MNLFDNLQQHTQAVVTQVMGYDASWTPLIGGGPFTARVLMNKPTQEQEVGDQKITSERIGMEYFAGDFPGLYESLEDREPEVIIINGISYLASIGEKKFDGKTIKLYLEPK